MRKIFLLIILLANVHLPAICCSCIGESTVASALKNADFVAVGTVKAKTLITATTALKEAKHVAVLNTVDTLSFWKQYRYTVEIEEVFKGKRYQKTVEIFTGLGGGDCGVEFSVGKQYIIYAKSQRTRNFNGKQLKVSTFLTTDICTRTTDANETELTELRKANPR